MLVTRRNWMRCASAGIWLGAVAARATESTSSTSRGFGRAKSVLFVVANGGQSQIDSWDPKPTAPQQVRGEFGTISTAVPGTQLCEHLPRMAALADRYAIVRSMSHEDLDHGSALYLTLTGQYHARRSSNPLPTPSDWPTHGAVVKRLRPPQSFVDSAVHLNGPAQVPIIVGPGQFSGLLGPDFEPLQIGDVHEQPTVLPGLVSLPELPTARRDLRRQLLTQLKAAPQDVSRDAEKYAALTEQAYAVLDRPEVQHAFDLQRETPALRERYGLDRSGQSLLLARRLVEAGVPWITVFWNHSGRGQDTDPHDPLAYGWDTHNDIFTAMRTHLLPRFDRSFSTLLEDLSQRGLLDQTLLVCAGEFGRAPLVAFEKNFAGESPGRKHWGAVYSILAAGAGVQAGTVVGASDRHGAFPVNEKYGPWDLTATMFSALGIDPESHFTDKANRPFPLTSGRVIEALYAR